MTNSIMQILKPAFTILAGHRSKSFFLVIRGTHSIKDTLTAVTGAVVPFHHTMVHEGGVTNLVLGYAHCGMVAAARWIAKLATPCLLKALSIYPEYKLKVLDIESDLSSVLGPLLPFYLFYFGVRDVSLFLYRKYWSYRLDLFHHDLLNFYQY